MCPHTLENGLMAQVDAIEIADGHGAGAL